mgnify:CR=1 FL=1
MVNNKLKRRAFMQGIGAGTIAASLAGCATSSNKTGDHDNSDDSGLSCGNVSPTE